MLRRCRGRQRQPPQDHRRLQLRVVRQCRSLPTPPAGHDAAAEVEYGAALFTHGKVTGSVDAFDTAMSWDGRVNGTLWQRGCARYYTEQWTEGAAQFAFDVSENPNDTEERVSGGGCGRRVSTGCRTPRHTSSTRRARRGRTW